MVTLKIVAGLLALGLAFWYARRVQHYGFLYPPLTTIKHHAVIWFFIALGFVAILSL